MSYLSARVSAILAGLVLALGLALAAMPAPPASALTFTAQCDLAGGCANFWGGGYAVSVDYGPLTANDNMTVQWINAAHTQFQIRDNIHGGCVGDLGGNPSSARAGGGQSCPSSGHAAYGSIFDTHSGCLFAGYGEYYNQHWGGYLGWGTANGGGAYLNTGGHCIQQRG